MVGQSVPRSLHRHLLQLSLRPLARQHRATDDGQEHTLRLAQWHPGGPCVRRDVLPSGEACVHAASQALIRTSCLMQMSEGLERWSVQISKAGVRDVFSKVSLTKQSQRQTTEKQ